MTMYSTERCVEIMAAGAILRGLHCDEMVRFELNAVADLIDRAAPLAPLVPNEACAILVKVRQRIRVAKERPDAWDITHALEGVIILLLPKRN